MVPYDCLDFERVSIPSVGFRLPTADSGDVAGALPFDIEGGSLSTAFPFDDTVICVPTFAVDMNPEVVLKRCLNRPTPIRKGEKSGTGKKSREKILSNGRRPRHIMMSRVGCEGVQCSGRFRARKVRNKSRSDR